MQISWRLASRLSVAVLAFLIVIVVTLLGMHEGASNSHSTSIFPGINSSGLQGTDLGGVAAPDFRLTDQYGQSVSLSQFKGKPVVVTFLYTHCPDQCPLTAEKLHAVMQSLGSDAQRVGVLAVSTDPKGDTIQAALDFSKKHRMQDYWHFLVGTHNELSPVWSNYSVYAAPENTTSGSVAHSLAVFVIDKQGRERAFFGDDFTSPQLTSDLQILLKE